LFFCSGATKTKNSFQRVLEKHYIFSISNLKTSTVCAMLRTAVLIKNNLIVSCFIVILFSLWSIISQII